MVAEEVVVVTVSAVPVSPGVMGAAEEKRDSEVSTVVVAAVSGAGVAGREADAISSEELTVPVDVAAVEKVEVSAEDDGVLKEVQFTGVGNTLSRGVRGTPSH
jgi:hypothetical protein